jgi:hypothetical protein
MQSSANIRSRRGQILWLLAGGIVAGIAASGGNEMAAQEGSSAASSGDCSGLRVVQGRITAIDGNFLSVKTPDGFPGGGPGIHAQFVTRGPEFRVDISAGRVLQPDGQQEDKQPLVVGERVVVVLHQSGEASGATVTAAIVERVSTSDRVATH